MLPLAEASVDVSGWAALAGSLANIGFAGWVTHYLLTKALPAMQTDFKDALRSERETAATTLEKAGGGHERALAVVVQHCEKESERHANTLKGEMAGMGKVIQDNREVLEEVRDALRDFKQQMTEFGQVLKERSRKGDP